MNVKKIRLISFTCLAMFYVSFSFAGADTPGVPSPQSSGLYLGVDFGYNSDTALKDPKVSDGSTDADSSGWTLSGLVGYKLNNNWSIQAGYIYNQDLAFKDSGKRYELGTVNAYVALKATIPLVDQFSGYLMVGPAYTRAHVHTIIKKTKYWSPMGAVGVSYAVNNRLSITMQTQFISDPTSAKTGKTTQRFTVGANTLFAL